MLHTLRNKLAVLCPETDGLQRKYRIKYVPNGRTREEKLEDVVNFVDEHCPFRNDEHLHVNWRDAHFISMVYWFEGFSSVEVFEALQKGRWKNY